MPALLRARVSSLGFVVDKVALGQVSFCKLSRHLPVNIIPTEHQTYIPLGKEQ
jgi:hypothetical protein